MYVTNTKPPRSQKRAGRFALCVYILGKLCDKKTSVPPKGGNTRLHKNEIAIIRLPD